MKTQNKKVFETKLIKKKLETAAYVEKLLPKIKANGYSSFGLMFPIKYSSQEIELMDKKPIRITPTHDQITLWETVVLEWLPALEREERKLVWERANRIPWKVICFEFQKSRQILTLRFNQALQKIGKTFYHNV